MKNFGCRFSLYPMSDSFINIILGALKSTDTSNIHSFTDAISTVYQGDINDVLNCVESLFENAYTRGVHMAIEGMFSNEEEVSAEVEHTKDIPTPDIHFPVKCKLSLYGTEKAKKIYEEKINSTYIEKEKISYGTRFGGDVAEVIDFINDLCKAIDDSNEKFTLHFTMNCNSPTVE